MKPISHLPQEFEFSHWYCFFLHDQLVETLKSAEKANVFNTVIQFKDDSHLKKINGLSGEEFITWLEANGYKIDVIVLYYKQLCAALLSDFLHFIYESLQCSKKGKLTVAYALLRKPLKENLFYMEWLLARPAEFLKRFEKADPKRFKLPHPNIPTESEHVKIIKEAATSTRTGEWINAEFLHELRFKKNSTISLEPTWQKANHLVTSFQYMETESCNLNFIFSNAESHYSQWHAYYSYVPILLFHAVQVVEALLEKFAKRQCHDYDIMPLRTYAGMILYLQHPPWESDMKEVLTGFVKNFEEAGLSCPRCKTLFKFDHENIVLLYKNGSLLCPNGCGKISLHL